MKTIHEYTLDVTVCEEVPSSEIYGLPTCIEVKTGRLWPIPNLNEWDEIKIILRKYD